GLFASRCFVGRNVSLTNPSPPWAGGGTNVTVIGTVGGHVTVNANNGPGTTGFALVNDGIAPGSIGGNVNVSLGAYATFEQDPGTNSGGNITVAGGAILASWPQ